MATRNTQALMKSIEQDLIEKWSSPLVARTHIEKFSGGILMPRDLANKDARGEGISPLLKRNRRKVCYRTEDAARYIVALLKVEAK